MNSRPVGRLGAAVEAVASGQTEDQVRRRKAQNDRKDWFAARHASQGYGILARDGREVGRCGKEADRDVILAAIRAEDAIGAAITALAFAEATYQRANDSVALAQTQAAKEGLVKALTAIDEAAMPKIIDTKPTYPNTTGGSVECPHCHWGFAPSAIDQHIREKH